METYIAIRITVLLGLIGLFAYTVYLIRAKKLSAHLAMSWIITELVLIATVAIEQIPAALRRLVGDENFYTVILLLVIGWIILLMLDTLVRVSDVEHRTRIMIQENGLLQRRIEVLEERAAALGMPIQDHQGRETEKHAKS
ncbi:MAG TPA: DUF2304 domain-containing protein [Anaerolineae bacterium]|nr:DUF2304 domain-containing protein [Anaerolineae bacterium]